jgi:hypothetical protein
MMNMKQLPLDDSGTTNPLWFAIADKDAARYLRESFVSILSPTGMPLSERGYAESFLNVVNGGRVLLSHWKQMIGGFVEESRSSSSGMDRESIEEYKCALDSLLASETRLTNQHLSVLANLVSETTLAIPRIALGANDVSVSYQIIGKDVYASLQYAYIMLVTKFADDLRRCRFTNCNAFFLIDPSLGKRKQREYCSEIHRNQQLEYGAKDRVHASRAGVTAQEWRALKAKDVDITPGEWKSIKRKSPGITPGKWIDKEKKGK